MTRLRRERDEAIARAGMVVAKHPLAAHAGVEVLEQGGNAVDAAACTSARPSARHCVGAPWSPPPPRARPGRCRRPRGPTGHRPIILPAARGAGAGLNLNSAFTTGRTAMFWPSGAPQFGAIQPAVQFDWDVGILPVGRGKPATGMGAPGYCLPREARNPDEAWALVNALSGKEAQLGEVVAGTITPSRKSVAFSPELLNQRPPEHTRVVSETLETIKLPLQLANWTDFQTALDGEMAPLRAGTKTAREATLATKQQLDPLLREARRLEEAAR